jgi:hypothetical protein
VWLMRLKRSPSKGLKGVGHFTLGGSTWSSVAGMGPLVRGKPGGTGKVRAALGVWAEWGLSGPLGCGALSGVWAVQGNPEVMLGGTGSLQTWLDSHDSRGTGGVGDE